MIDQHSINPSLKVMAEPYPYYLPLGRTALMMIDMQRDFILPGGFGDSLGNDVTRLAAAIPIARRLLDWCRQHGLMVIHTKEAHAPDLSDCPPAKLQRGHPRLHIGDAGPWAAS